MALHKADRAWFIAIGAAWVSWFVILIWLRHVTVWHNCLKRFFGSDLCGMAIFAKCILPQLVARNILIFILGFAGIAGAWVLLEWSRTWFWRLSRGAFGASQWERPVVLQIN